MLITALEKQFLASSNPEDTFFRHLRDVIASCKPVAQRTKDCGRAGPFRPLLVGYSGAGNIGSDIRVAEMIRQFRVVFARVGFDPTLTVLEKVRESFYDGVRQMGLPRYFPDFLEQQQGMHDAVIVCEGSMFTSIFSDVLTGIFAASLAYASKEGIPAIGYGATAGTMTMRLKKFVADSCRDSFVLCRGAHSEQALSKLGINALPGADPAWTFEPECADGAAQLRSVGWNGSDKVITVCPINPFWWPVEIDFAKAKAMLKSPHLRQEHFRSFLFHRQTEEGRAKYDRYLAALAKNISGWQSNGYFPVLVAMERLDRKNCTDLQAKLRFPIPQFVSGEFGMDAICAVLRIASLVVSSRFHATVLALSGGVPAIGITMDSRIDELFAANGIQDWVLRCDAPTLEESVQAISRELLDGCDMARHICEQATASQIRAVGRMGLALVDHLSQRDERFAAVPRASNWDAYLPPLSKRLEHILAAHA